MNNPEQIKSNHMQELIHKHFDKDRCYHEIIAQEYDSVVVLPRKVTNDILFRKFSELIKPSNKMLDIACGTGHMVMRFASRFSEITAVDHSKAMLDQARLKASERNFDHIKFIEQNVLDYLINAEEDCFDFISCVGFLHHLPSGRIPSVVESMFKLLRKFGILLVSEPVKVQEDIYPMVIQRWNRRSLAFQTRYSSQVEEPDEEPLDSQFLYECLNNLGLLLKVQRHFEIFPHNSPPKYWDRLAIMLMNKIYGQKGNVMTIAVNKI